MRWALQPGEQGLHITSPAFHLGAAGDEEDDEVVLDGDESNAGLEEERLEGPEGERVGRGLWGEEWLVSGDCLPSGTRTLSPVSLNRSHKARPLARAEKRTLFPRLVPHGFWGPWWVRE